MEPDFYISREARKIVERSFKKGRRSFTLYHNGISMSYEADTGTAHVTAWQLEPAYFVILIVRDGDITLTGYPGCHQSEHFGAINSLKFYLDFKEEVASA